MYRTLKELYDDKYSQINRSKYERSPGDCLRSHMIEDGCMDNSGLRVTGRWFFYITDKYIDRLWGILKDRKFGIGSKTFRANDHPTLFKVITYTKDYRDIDYIKSIGKELLDILSEFGINKIFHVICYYEQGKSNPCSSPRFDTPQHTMIKIGGDYIFSNDRFKPKDKREIFAKDIKERNGYR